MAKSVRRIVACNAPMTVDSSSEQTNVAFSQNVLPSPDGSYVFTRYGSEIHRQYAPPTAGSDLKLRIDPVVPGLGDGTSLAMIQGEDGIRDLALFKERTAIQGDSGASKVHFSATSYTDDYGHTVTVTVRRVGALDKACTVTYATANGTATAGTDYTAASGTLSFAAGDVSKTFTVTSINIGQTTDKTIELSLLVGTNCIIDSPQTAQIVLDGIPAYLLASPVACHRSQWSTSVMSVIMWDYTAGTTKLHYITGMPGITGAFGGPTRCGPNHFVFTTTDSGKLYANLVDITALVAAGAAYSAGAADFADAITTAATSIESDAASTTVSQRVYQYDSTCFYLSDGVTLYKINLTTPALTSKTAITYTGIAGTPDSFLVEDVTTGAIDASGNIAEVVEFTTPASVQLVTINPATATLVAKYDLAAEDFGCVAPIAGGGLVGWGGGTGPNPCSHLLRFDAGLTTKTDLGAPYADGFDYSFEAFLPIGSGAKILLPNDNIWGLHQIAIGSATFTDEHTYDDLALNFGWHTAFLAGGVLFASFSLADTILVKNASTFATVATVTFTEPYGAAAKDTAWADAISDVPANATWGDLFYYLPQRDGRYTP